MLCLKSTALFPRFGDGLPSKVSRNWGQNLGHLPRSEISQGMSRVDPDWT